MNLAWNDGASIRVWHGRVEGTLRRVAEEPADAFGFDAFFVPAGGGGLSLYELAAAGRKRQFSARAAAAAALLGRQPDIRVAIADVPEWQGAWQAAQPGSHQAERASLPSPGG